MFVNRRCFVARFSLVGGALTIAGSRLCLGAQLSAPKVLETRTGVVVATDRNIIYMTDSSGPVTVRISSSTRIWKGELGVDVSAIRPGDEIAVRGVRGADGSVVASQLWVNIVSLDGTITAVNGAVVSVREILHESLGEIKSIKLTDKTVTEQDNPVRKEDVQIGRYVHIIGLALEDGTVQATRFTVYVNGRPVDSRATKYVEPDTGQAVKK